MSAEPTNIDFALATAAALGVPLTETQAREYVASTNAPRSSGMNPLIAEARLVAPHTEDGFLLLRLADALEAAEKMAEAAPEDLADESTQDNDDADTWRKGES